MVIDCPAKLPLGIFELDSAGRVLAFSVHDSDTTREIIGKNFFTDVLHNDGSEIQQRFQRMYTQHIPFNKFSVYSGNRLRHSILMMFFPDTNSVTINIDQIAIA